MRRAWRGLADLSGPPGPAVRANIVYMAETNFSGAAGAIAQLPPAKDLIAEARAAMDGVAGKAAGARLRAASRALDAYAPAIDELVSTADAAVFVGYKSGATISRMRIRPRADGSKAWPDPDRQFGQSPVWKIRTIVLHQAQAPGRGHPGASLGRTGAGRRGAARDDHGRFT